MNILSKLIRYAIYISRKNLLRFRDFVYALFFGLTIEKLIKKARFSQAEAIKEAKRVDVKPEKLLILIPCRNVARFLPIMEKNLLRLTYPQQMISIGFLESFSADDTYVKLQDMCKKLDRKFAKVSLLQSDQSYLADLSKEEIGIDEKVGERMKVNQEDSRQNIYEKQRWQTAKQMKRRRRLALSRNLLLQNFLKPQDKWVLWIDADVIHWTQDVIEQLMSFDKAMIVPHCVREDDKDVTYDLNSFKYVRDKKYNWQAYINDGLLAPPPGMGRSYLSDYKDYDLVPLDAVGGTMVLVKADLHREGLIYPPYEYHKHIETEAMAFMARDIFHSGGYYGSWDNLDQDGYRDREVWGAPNVTIVHPIYD